MSATSARDEGTGSTVIGMALMTVAMLILPVGDGLSKLLTTQMPAPETTMWRLVSQGGWLVVVAAVLRRRLRGRMFSPVVALCGVTILITLLGLIGAFAVMPIATAIAIFFVEPFILTLLSAAVLGERIGRRRITACCIGMLGALVVIRPGFGVFGWATLLPLMAAVAYAINMIVLRFACRSRDALTVQCGATIYAAAIAVAGIVVLKALGWIDGGLPGEGWPTWVWPVIVLAGSLAAVAYVMIAEAFSRAEAGALAPLQYVEILGATAVGWLAFGTFPDALTWVGVAIILGSGLYVIRRERRAEA